MTTLNIQISEELMARIEAKAAKSGFDGIESYVQAMIESEVSDQVVEEEDLEKLLLQRLGDDNGIELTASFVNQFKNQVADRRQNKAGS